MTIHVWNYLEEYAQEKAEVHAAVDTVFNSGRLILGEQVRQFENEFAAYCGAAHGVGLDNGTNSITLALLALGLEPGDEVITVPNTAVPTVSAIVNAGGVPRFVDIEPDSYLMDVAQLEAIVTPRTRAIVPVHLYGQCVDMQALQRVADKHDLFVVEDCAQAHGAEYFGRKAGSLADAASFSFYPTKILGGFGDGAMVTTDHAAVNDKLRRLRFYGMEKTYYAEEHGYNSRLDELQAAILRNKLRHLPTYVERRRELASRYRSLLADTDLLLPCEERGNRHAYYVYVVRHPERDAIMQHLKAHDIHVNISYPWPIHTMRGYRRLGYREGDFPHAEAAAKEIFSLPMYPMLSNEQQDRVCEVLCQLSLIT